MKHFVVEKQINFLKYQKIPTILVAKRAESIKIKENKAQIV